MNTNTSHETNSALTGSLSDDSNIRPLKPRLKNASGRLSFSGSARKNCLLVIRGKCKGSKIALSAPTTIIGENAKNFMIIEQMPEGGYNVLTADATVLVTRNGDPLPPVPQVLQSNDVLGFSDYEVQLQLI